MEQSKLVRDRIPDIIRKRGETPVTHVADADEYQQRLNAKLKEEIDEFLQDGSKEELADILEVLYALGEIKGADKDDLERLRKKKAKDRGGFKDKIILDRVE